MKIAHLIVAHNDPVHIQRLAKRLASFSDVFIHVDKKANLNDFHGETKNIHNCYYTKNRFKVSWGGLSVVKAELELLKEARGRQTYDRYVLLHGADYPLKCNSEILSFFEENREIEFIRSCCISDSDDTYFSDKCSRIWFMDTPIRLFRIIANKVPIRIRSGYITIKSTKLDVFWGSALWALTNSCVDYILKVSENTKFLSWFKYSYVPDELYFHTIVMNSVFAKKTLYKESEPRKRGLVSWRNLHYFEYQNQIKIWQERDYDFLSSRPELYIRKVNTLQSSSLLDLLDSLCHRREADI